MTPPRRCATPAQAKQLLAATAEKIGWQFLGAMDGSRTAGEEVLILRFGPIPSAPDAAPGAKPVKMPTGHYIERWSPEARRWERIDGPYVTATAAHRAVRQSSLQGGLRVVRSEIPTAPAPRIVA